MTLPKIRIPVGAGAEPVELSAKQAGQIIVVFALMLTVLIGMVGIAIDTTYAWRNALQVQRAADAAAMAGVVYMPSRLDQATVRANAIALSNGYASGVTVAPNPTDTRQLDVTITASVPTFFIRIFGINSWQVSRTARAAYIMPVPMGSPLSYMGVGCLVRSGVTAPACDTTGTGNSGVTTLGTSGGSPLASLGAWGAVITKGGNQENGDAYMPANNSPGTSWTVNTSGSNVLYDAAGYYYTAVVPAGGGGVIKIFDPGFCEQPGRGNTSYGTGDHWIGYDNTETSSTNPHHYSPVSTYYKVKNTNGVLTSPSAWTDVMPWTTQFVDQRGTEGGAHGSGTCDSYHNSWYTLISGLGAGTYEVEVSTTKEGDPTENATTNAENMFALMVTSTNPGATIYGYDKMAVYNNLSGTSGALQQFYLAKVDQPTGIGKTLTIDLFDVGDSTAGTIQIMSPDVDYPAANPALVTNFSYTTFNYNATGQRVNNGNCHSGVSDLCSDTGRSSINVNSGSGSSFNNTWIEITILMGDTYGQPNNCPAYPDTGGNHDQPCLWQGGWWQVKYNVTGGNDTTTWSVNVNGNPVRLVPIP
jgi:hypothetical protein